MTDVPRRMPPSPEKRLLTIADHTAGGSLRGATNWGKSVPGQRGAAVSMLAGRLVVIQHGDDGAVPRPVGAVVYWIGAATPVNALPYDFWYPANA